ncbi:MAG TPA: tripartite tricarboxylate transporter substrate binding protein [Burkholderiaceae bacterium]|jgi:tripartite-type tricarboxylate transporter receptor subunit TctC
MKKMLVAVAMSIAALGAQTPSHAQTNDYPDRPIRMLLPFGAGGGGDTLGRLLAERMGKRLGQPIIVDNKPGAGGTLGAMVASQQPPDGYSISIGGMTTHTLAPSIYAKLPYDPIKSFVTVGRIGTSAILMVATNDFPANNLKEFIALAKEKPLSIQYASWGIGSTGHFCAEVLAQKAGIKLMHVPYKGVPPIITDMLGGHIKVAFVDMASGSPFVQEGKIKAIAACTQRSPSLPKVASYKEQGVDFDHTLSWVMYLPAGTPKPITEKISNALQASLAEPDVVTKLLAVGITPDFLAGDAQAAANALDIPIWRQIAKDANITPE